MTHATILSISDLDLTDPDAPRILDTRLGEVLGMARPRNIRQFIERNVAELSRYGEVCCTVQQTSAKGGRPGKQYWLTEGQALCLSALSDAPNGPDARQMLISVFMAHRRGLAPLAATTPIPSLSRGQEAMLRQARLSFGADAAIGLWAKWGLDLPDGVALPPPGAVNARASFDALVKDLRKRGQTDSQVLNAALECFAGLAVMVTDRMGEDGHPLLVDIMTGATMAAVNALTHLRQGRGKS